MRICVVVFAPSVLPLKLKQAVNTSETIIYKIRVNAL